MSTPIEALLPAAAALAAQAATALPVRKRKLEEDEQPDAGKALKTEAAAPAAAAAEAAMKPAAAVTQEVVVKQRGVRLEQNRKAARESRRRKKTMIEELQRSVIFFSRANGTLKQQNDELTRLLMQAQGQITGVDGDGKVAAKPAAAAAAMAPPPPKKVVEHQDEAAELARANAVATQAMYESQGFPAAAARAAAQTMNFGATAASASGSLAPPATNPLRATLPAMQPGATMQAMANFQQAAAAAMQAAMGQMQEIPGINTSQLAAAPVGTNAQQAYTDTMTALAMQQAAASAGQQFLAHPGMQYLQLQPVMNQWQQLQVVAVQQAQAQTQPTAPPVESKKEE